MADNLLVPVTTERILDSNGDPVSGAKVHVYNAGTSDAVTNGVWTDIALTSAGANPMVADSGGYLAARYVGTGSYKLLITTSADVTIKTEDNLPGALDTSSFSNDQAINITPVITKSANYTIQTTDQGKIVATDSTSGDVTITLLSAVTAGDDFRITIKHVGTANNVGVSTTGGQTIDGESSYSLNDQYEAITATSDGANWHISDSARLVADITTSPLPRGYLGGLQLSNDTDTAHDIAIAIGECRDAVHGSNLALTAIMTKQIDASWAVGDDAGGMASGVSLDVDTWYHVFLVDLDAGGTDAGFDTSITATNLLATTDVGTKFRRIGSVLTDGSSNILGFTQIGNHLLWDDPPLDHDDATSGTNAITVTLSTPLGVSTLAHLNLRTEGVRLYMSSLDQDDEVPSTTAAPIATIGDDTDGGWGTAWIRTNTSSQIRGRQSTNAVIRVVTNGWIDARGTFD